MKYLIFIVLLTSGCATTKPKLIDSYLYHKQSMQQKQRDRDMKDIISTERILEQINTAE